jgi:hypothetical protein
MMSNDDSFSNIAPGAEQDKSNDVPKSNIEDLNLDEKSILKEDLKQASDTSPKPSSSKQKKTYDVD